MSFAYVMSCHAVSLDVHVRFDSRSQRCRRDRYLLTGKQFIQCQKAGPHACQLIPGWETDTELVIDAAVIAHRFLLVELTKTSGVRLAPNASATTFDGSFKNGNSIFDTRA